MAHDANPSGSTSPSARWLLSFIYPAGPSKDVLLFLARLFGLLHFVGLLLDGLGDLLHDDLFDLVLELFCLPALILNGRRHLLLDRFVHQAVVLVYPVS